MTQPTIGQLQVEVVAEFDRFVRDLRVRLAAIAKDAVIEMRVKIRERTLGALNSKLKSFSGANALAQSFQNASRHVTGFFDNIGSIAKKSTLIAGALGPLTVGLASLAPAVAALGVAAAGGIAALPGILLGLGAAGFVFKSAFSEIPPAVQQSMDKFKELKGLINKNFWAEASGGVKLFLDSAIGPLKEGFGQLATSMGEFTSHLAGSFARAFTPEVYQGFFGGLTKAFDILDHEGFTDALANISAKLVEFAGQIFPQIAQGLADITNKFSEFLNKNPDFLMNAWETFVGVLKGLFSVIGSLIGIFGGLSKAATEAGIGAASLSNPLKALSDAINSVSGQKALTEFFRDAKAGMSGLGEAMGPLGGLFSSLAPILGNFIREAGVALGQFGSALFDSLNRPEVLTGISSLLESFPKIFTNLIPSIDLVTSKIGQIASLGGVVVDELSKTLNSAIQAILPALTPLFKPIEDFVKAAGPALRGIFEQIGPKLQELTPVFQQLIGAATSFMKALDSPAAKFIIGLILDFIKTAVSGFANLVTGVLQFVDGLLKVLSGDFSGFSKMFSGIGNILQGVFQLFITFFAPAKILGIVGRAFAGVGRSIGGPILSALVGLIGRIPVIGIRLAQGLISSIGGFVTRGIPAIGQNLIKGLIQGATAVIGGLIAWLTEKILDPVKAFFGIASPSTVFAELGRFLIEGLINGIKAMIGFLVGLFQVPIDAIKALFTAGFDAIKTVVTAVWDAIKAAGELLWAALTAYFNAWKTVITTGIAIVQAVVSAVWSAIQAAGAAVWDYIKMTFENMKAIISAGIAILQAVVSAVWEAIKAAGAAVWTTIQTAFNVFMAIVNAGAAVLRAVVIAVWDAIKAAGQLVWTTIQNAFNTAKAIISAGIAVLQAVVNAVWTALKAAGQAVWTAIQAAFNTMKGVISGGIAALQGVVSGVWNALKALGTGVWDAIKGAFNGAKSAITGGVDAIKTKFFSAFEAIKDKVLGIFKTIKDKIPKISIPGLSKLPGFATGVKNFSGGYALVGERGPEIVGLPRGSDVYTASQTRGMLGQNKTEAGGGGIHIGSITINEAGRAPAESLPRALRNLAFTMGAA